MNKVHKSCIKQFIESSKFIKLKDRSSYKEGKVFVKLRIYIESDLLEKTFETDFSDQKNINRLEKGAEDFLKAETKTMIDKLQKDYKSDDRSLVLIF